MPPNLRKDYNLPFMNFKVGIKLKKFKHLFVSSMVRQRERQHSRAGLTSVAHPRLPQPQEVGSLCLLYSGRPSDTDVGPSCVDQAPRVSCYCATVQPLQIYMYMLRVNILSRFS